VLKKLRKAEKTLEEVVGKRWQWTFVVGSKKEERSRESLDENLEGFYNGAKGRG